MSGDASSSETDARELGPTDELTEADVIAAVPRRQWRRPILVAVIFFGLLAIAELTGVREMFSRDNLRQVAQGSGILGFLAFIGVYVAGNLLHVPGWVFIVTASAAYGPLWGFFAAYLGGVIAVSISFVIVRRLGGKSLREIRWGPAKKILGHLELRPIATMVVLRTLLAISPPLNYVLALSIVRFRDYFVAASLGLVVPVLFIMFVFELIMQWF